MMLKSSTYRQYNYKGKLYGSKGCSLWADWYRTACNILVPIDMRDGMSRHETYSHPALPGC